MSPACPSAKTSQESLKYERRDAKFLFLTGSWWESIAVRQISMTVPV